MALRRSAATLCLLSCLFAVLTIASKQFALIWWLGCIVSAFAGTILVANSLRVHEPLPSRLLKASVFIVPTAAIALALIFEYVMSR